MNLYFTTFDWSISTTKHWNIHFNHLRCSRCWREVGDYDWTKVSTRFHWQQKMWMFIMTHLSIIEVQISKLKYLNTVELIYVLQGRRITTFQLNLRICSFSTLIGKITVDSPCRVLSCISYRRTRLHRHWLATILWLILWELTFLHRRGSL